MSILFLSWKEKIIRLVLQLILLPTSISIHCFFFSAWKWLSIFLQQPIVFGLEMVLGEMKNKKKMCSNSNFFECEKYSVPKTKKQTTEARSNIRNEWTITKKERIHKSFLPDDDDDEEDNNNWRRRIIIIQGESFQAALNHRTENGKWTKTKTKSLMNSFLQITFIAHNQFRRIPITHP